MNMLQVALPVILILLSAACANTQQKPAFEPHLIGGPCEGCEAILEYGDRKLTPTDTLPEFHGPGQPIKVMGTVFEPDGKTPAANVILYFYHTDQTGVYPTRGDETGWARRHGYIRAWIKTDKDGHYAIYTRKPAPYPHRTDPAHIHLTVLEPDGKYYWVGSYHFAGDPLLTEKQKDPAKPRGGTSGLLHLEKEGNLWVGKRDLILGKNL